MKNKWCSDCILDQQIFLSSDPEPNLRYDNQMKLIQELIKQLVERKSQQINLINLLCKQTIKQNSKDFLKLSIQNSNQSFMLSNTRKKQLRIQTNDTLDKTFKQYSKTISESIQKLNSFTDNLEEKVNTLLKAQQTQFVTSYQNHMSKIKTELSQMDRKLIQYQQKIQFYENEGRLSHYVKKVSFMEFEQIKLFQQISVKDKKIKELQCEVQLLRKMQKNSDEQMKKMFRKKIEDDEQRSIEKDNLLTLRNQRSQKNMEKHNISIKHMSSIDTFATQIPTYHYRKGKLAKSHSKERNLSAMITQSEQRSVMYQSHNYSGHEQEEDHLVRRPQDIKSHRISALEKQLLQLKSQNKKLLVYNSKYASSLSELGEFFLHTTEELKKSIGQKRKIKSDVKFEDFCKQDKLVLIAALISNEAALQILYDNLFKPRLNKNRAQSVLQKSYGVPDLQAPKGHRKIEEIMANPEYNVPLTGKLALPSIRSKRLVF